MTGSASAPIRHTGSRQGRSIRRSSSARRWKSFSKAVMKKSRGTSYGAFPSFGTRSKSSARSKSKIGYDAFKPKIVEEHAREAFTGWIDEDMIVRRSKIIHVALFNLLNQGAADRKREHEVDKLKRRLENAWEDGQVAGYRDALEMFYQRNK